MFGSLLTSLVAWAPSCLHIHLPAPPLPTAPATPDASTPQFKTPRPRQMTTYEVGPQAILAKAPVPHGERNEDLSDSAGYSLVFRVIGGSQHTIREPQLATALGPGASPARSKLKPSSCSQSRRSVFALQECSPPRVRASPFTGNEKSFRFGAFKIYFLVAEGGVGGVLGEPAYHHAAGTGYRAGPDASHARFMFNPVGPRVSTARSRRALR